MSSVDDLVVTCNRCGVGERGKMYVMIKCEHLICMGCARQLTGSNCPICGLQLGEEDVQEVVVGLRVHSELSMRRTMMEAAFSGHHWSDIARNASFLLEVATSITNLNQRQLLFELEKREQMRAEEARLLGSSLANVDELNMRALQEERKREQTQQALKARLAEVEERLELVTQGYKEKSKRCSAFEAAYRRVTGAPAASSHKGRKALPVSNEASEECAHDSSPGLASTWPQSATISVSHGILRLPLADIKESDRERNPSATQSFFETDEPYEVGSENFFNH